MDTRTCGVGGRFRPVDYDAVGYHVCTLLDCRVAAAVILSASQRVLNNGYVSGYGPSPSRKSFVEAPRAKSWVQVSSQPPYGSRTSVIGLPSSGRHAGDASRSEYRC